MDSLMNQDERIEQFRKMAQANPDDDLAHFALGQALSDAGRPAEAVNVLRHVLKINPGYSRAYVVLGDSQLVTEDVDGAIETFQAGYAAAMSRGDLMPGLEMKQKLADLGETVSADAILQAAVVEVDADDAREPGPGEVRCARTKKIGKSMVDAPFADDVGQWILENISAESWDDWMEMSIKLINELRLDLGDRDAQRIYDEHMRDFLGVPMTLFSTLAEGEAEDEQDESVD
ncbi:MAG: Fe(2+)-trafficking protein [Myxococcota bacterium]|nr:Fe(2+)-trafficking protein [Myxococcota bacterium]